MKSVTLVMPTIPREPSTLTHSVKTVVRSMSSHPEWQFHLFKNTQKQPETEKVAKDFGLILHDGTVPNPIQHTGHFSSRDSSKVDIQSPTYRTEGKAAPPILVLWAMRYWATRLKIGWESSRTRHL